MSQPYQPMRSMSKDEFALLKADIAKNGVLVAIEVDENGVIIDGHHRVQACLELGKTDYPKQTVTGLSDEEKIERAKSINLSRRNNTKKELKARVVQMAIANPKASMRAIARVVGIDDKTVKAVLVSSAEIPQKDRKSAVDVALDVIRDCPEISYDDLKKRTGSSRNVLAAARQKAAALGLIAPPKTSKNRAEVAEKIRQLAEDGCTRAQAAKEVGYGVQGIANIAKDYGIEFPSDVIVNARKIKPERVVWSIVESLEAQATGAELVADSLGELESQVCGEWVNRIEDSLKSIRRLVKALREKADGNAD